MEKMKLVVVTGLSGAGKTNAMDWFEDGDTIVSIICLLL